MQLTVLVDNHTLIDRYLVGEPGISLLVRDADVTVLLDVGYSDAFLVNARKLGRNLGEVDYVALSHGHLDHTWGLEPLARYYTELAIEKIPHRRPTLVAHPDTFVSVSDDEFPEFGSLMSVEKLAKHFRLQLSVEPQRVGERLVYLGQIPRVNDFEGRRVFGRKDGQDRGDLVPEDSALVYCSVDGLVVMTGCAHAGICNTIEYAKAVCGDSRVADIVGGLHLMSPAPEQLEGTLAYLQQLRPRRLHACHCTDLRSKIALAGVVPLEEVGCGTVLEYD